MEMTCQPELPGPSWQAAETALQAKHVQRTAVPQEWAATEIMWSSAISKVGFISTATF